MRGDDRTLALVMGDIDLVRPLALAGIRCALFAVPRASVRLSRSVAVRLPWVDHWRRPEDVAALIDAFCAAQRRPPVLMPQSDGDLLVVSRHRERLAASSRFVLADAELVEDLADKERFAALAARLDLPVPPSARVDAREQSLEQLGLRPPLVVKPLLRDSGRWGRLEPAAKAMSVPDRAALAALWPQLAAAGVPVLVQEAVPGGEERIESFHAYVDDGGALVAGFTGRKVRTRPARYGHSTALETTDAPDVAELGRHVLDRLGLRGVAKVDVKRAADGTLHLLEVNPRFTLWHHPAALAGVNVPALVFADLTGAPRPPVGRVRPGVRWCLPVADLSAARAQGVTLRAWLRWLAACEARSGLAPDDPLPFLGDVGWERAARVAQRLRSRRRTPA